MRLALHIMQSSLIPTKMPKLTGDPLHVFILPFRINQQIHVLIDFLEEVLEQFGVDEFVEVLRDH